MLIKTSVLLTGLALMTVASTSSFAQGCRSGGVCEDYARHASERWMDGNDAVENALADVYVGDDYGAIPVHARQKNIGNRAGVVRGGVLVGLRPDVHVNQKIYNDAYKNCLNQFKFRKHQYVNR